MKRKICSIFMILMAFVLILGFNSCDEEPGDDGDSGGDSGCASVGHTWVDADCDNPKTCSVCQATEGEKLGHDYTEKVSDQAHQKTASASCTVKDTYWYDCSRCDKNAKDDPSATQKYYEAETAGAHNVDQMWSIENGEHFRKCLASGCNYVTDKAACSGGVATCSSKAVCQTCNSEYGSFGDHDYDLDAWGYKGQDGHAHNCKYCIAHDTVLPHTPNVDVPTEQTAKICTTSGCGYVIETVIHDHTPSSEFEYDNTHHWHDCVYNDEQIYGKETHSFDNACDTTCNGGCGYTRSIQHSYTVTDKNETQHWKKCSVCQTIDQTSKANHSFDNACDTTCNGGCGYTRSIRHSYTVTDKNETQHWKKCSVCQTIDQTSKANHSFDNACDATCNGGCGYTRTVSHSYTVLKKNDTEHWYECSACNDEKPASRIAHDHKESVTNAATTFQPGLAKYTCMCGDSYDSILPATKSLKLLAIGNSFSEDAFMHLYLVCKDAGIEEIVLGNLFIGGCSLEKHYSKMSTDAADYIFWVSDEASNGMIKYDGGNTTTAKFGIEYADWDYITLQQNSANSGFASTYEWLDDVIAYVNQYKTNENAQFFWHMTWAYQGDSTHSSFPKYDKDQLKMYNAILGCVNDVILTNPDIKGVVPSGTTIQNLRNSHLGDTLTRDGHHLSNGIGRYAAALTYLAAITGYDINDITATPAAYHEVADHLNCIKEAAANAIAKPYEITPSVEYPYVAPPEAPTEILGTTLLPLSQSDREFLAANNKDPDKYMLLDLEITEHAYYNSTSKNDDHNVLIKTGSIATKYLATQVFKRNELPNGTLIRTESGYKYRPDAWVDFDQRNTYTRPGEVTTSGITEINDAWWVTSDSSVSYNYRAFNIYGPNNPISADEASNFKIYVPVAKKSELNAEDRAYLTGLGLDPNDYMVLDYTYSLHGYYNSTTSSSLSLGTTDLHKQFICTNEKFTRYDIPLGSIIHIPDLDYKYRPEGWITPDKKVVKDDRPGTVSSETVVVDVAWWKNWGYRAFNITTKDGTEIADPGDKALLRIYVPVDRKYLDLTEEDKTYLTGLGLNADEYKVLNFDYTVNAFYDASSNGSALNPNHATLSRKYIGTEIFTRDDLTLGSVIRITKDGYKYRAEGWIALDQKVEKGDRPAVVDDKTVIIDEQWWGDWNYRGFNISSSESNHTMTNDEASALRIYVKIA